MSGSNPPAAVPTVRIASEVEMPVVGYGVFQIPPEDTERAVASAIEVGYRHIDTAAVYGNEEAVGAGIRASGIDRSRLFVTTKLWNDAHGRESARNALEESLRRLGLDYVDLYLIHWPTPARARYSETWAALIEAKDAGATRSIGVSNFNHGHIETLVRDTGVRPSVNQIELHPYLAQVELLRWMHRAEIITTAWSPLAKAEVLADPLVQALAATYERTPAQVVLRWHLQRGSVVIPKSVTAVRMRSNLEVFDFELAGDDVIALEALDRGYRTGPNPEEFN